MVKKYELHFVSLFDNSLQIFHVGESGKSETLGTIKLIKDKSRNIQFTILLSPEQAKELYPVTNFLQDALSRCRDSRAVNQIIDDLIYGKPLN